MDEWGCHIYLLAIHTYKHNILSERTTADPRVFGPYTWRTLHRFMQHYPETPSSQTQTACVNFVNALPFLIPCPHCGYDFSQVSDRVKWLWERKMRGRQAKLFYGWV